MTQPPSIDGIPPLLYDLPNILDPLPIADWFAAGRPLEVELGSGDGSFLLAYAISLPEVDFIGVERLLGRVRKIDRKGRRAGLQNLRLIRLEAKYVLDYLLPEQSVRAVHIYFPDPWPKRRHQERRLIQERFMPSLLRVLLPGGMVYVRTDNEEYFAQMLSVFSESSDFSACETPEDLLSIKTDFERGFNAQGIATRYAAYRKADPTHTIQNLTK